MIDISNIHNSEPYIFFKKYYEKALRANQNYIEAIAISSINKKSNEVDSRFVNLKKIDSEEWVFFSNYQSPKAKQFDQHNQISALFFWDKIGLQIRIKANIKLLDEKESDKYFSEREFEKNVLAISSKQSKKIKSYKEVVSNYKNLYKKLNKDVKRPPYWGGFKFKPFYFEFWEGNEYRINKRLSFELIDKKWKDSFLEP